MATAQLPAPAASEIQLVAFYVADLLIGAEIAQVEEINRHLEITPVPHAPPSVRGVVNLRGDVVTVIDLRAILGLNAAAQAVQQRYVVVRTGGERVGLEVERIADVIRVPAAEIGSPPANVPAEQARFFRGVYKLEKEILVVLDVEAAVHAVTPSSPGQDCD